MALWPLAVGSVPLRAGRAEVDRWWPAPPANGPRAPRARENNS